MVGLTKNIFIYWDDNCQIVCIFRLYSVCFQVCLNSVLAAASGNCFLFPAITGEQEPGWLTICEDKMGLLGSHFCQQSELSPTSALLRDISQPTIWTQPPTWPDITLPTIWLQPATWPTLLSVKCLMGWYYGDIISKLSISQYYNTQAKPIKTKLI